MKRFYKTVSVERGAGGYQVCLDGRPVRSPAKAVMWVPTETLAEAVLAEWQAVEDEIRPEDMPMHSMMVTVLDRVTPQREVLAEELTRHAVDDVLRYRSADDVDLAIRQKDVWDPWLSWASDNHNLVLSVTSGLMPASFDEAAGQLLKNSFAPMSDEVFGCLYRAATLSGSVVLALAFQDRALVADELFETAFLDELLVMYT